MFMAVYRLMLAVAVGIRIIAMPSLDPTPAPPRAVEELP
jgi:hypothetical protein